MELREGELGELCTVNLTVKVRSHRPPPKHYAARQVGANRGAGRVGRRRKVFSAVRGWSKQGCLSCMRACVMLCCAQTIERREEIAVLLRDANRLRTPAPCSSIGCPSFMRHAPSAPPRLLHFR